MVGFGSSAAKQPSKRLVVGVGDMSVSEGSEMILSTFALGSCVGIVLFDAQKKIGGLLHVMLPTSSIAAEKSRDQPGLFADTGVEKFVSMFKSMNTDLSRTKCVIAGGASVMSSNDAFKIGQKNADAVSAKLQELEVRVDHALLGGFTNRSLHLDLNTGKLTISLPTEKKEISLA